MTIACMEVLHVGHGGTTKHMYNFGRYLHACPSKFPSVPFNASTYLRITMTCMEVLHVSHGCTTKHMYNFGRCLHACPSKFPSAPFNTSTCLRIIMACMEMACMEVLHVDHGCTTKHMYNFGRCLHACPSKFSSALFYASTYLRLTMTCMEVLHVGHGGTTSSDPWNFYLTHHLNEAYVDILGGRLGSAASYF
jgi:hypothetical protein